MTTIVMRPLSEQLTTFFGAYTETRKPENPSLSVELAGFFDCFSQCRSKVEFPKKSRPTIDPGALEIFLANLEKPLIASRQAAFQFDPWEVAGLGDDEVRNTRVLAWLLNPRGSHGLGLTAMNGMLTTVSVKLRSIFNDDFSMDPGSFCRVRTEINPNGEIADRVDVEIDAENFYLIIEVKIYAPEQPGQLERYFQQAELRAGNRPWAIIFLTPQGRKPGTAGEYADSGRIVCLSWKQLAAMLERELPCARSTSDQVQSVSRQFVVQAARRFLNKIRLF